VRALVDRQQSIAEGGSRGEAARKGVVQLGGHNRARNAYSANVTRSPAPLVRLERRDGLRSLPIELVLMLTLHHKRRTCMTRKTISARKGRCKSWQGPLRVLELGVSAGGWRGLPGRSKRGAIAQKGAKGCPGPLSGEGASLRFCPGLFYIVTMHTARRSGMPGILLRSAEARVA
jgi:hypothetical protein